MIIDSHQHLPSITKIGSIEKAKSKLINELKRNSVDHAILIPDNTTESEIGNLDQVLELTKNDNHLSMMGTINIQKKDYPTQTRKLDKLFQEQKIVAVKIFPGFDPIYPTDKRLIPAYELCIKYNLPIVIHTGASINNPGQSKYNDPKHIVKIAGLYPSLKIVIAHYFFPKVEYCYKLTKKFDNIFFDTSGLADKEVIQETGLDNIRNVLLLTIRESHNKVIFGSDYAMCNIRDHIELIESLDIERCVKDKILGENAVNLFRIKLQ